MATKTIILDGHIIDSLLLPKVLDLILDKGGTHYIEQIQIGHTRQEPSHAVIRIEAPDEAILEAILRQAEEHGASRVG